MRAVARASGGAAEFIAPGERIEAKVLRQFRRVLAPALLDVQVAWPGEGLAQAPPSVPPVFAGERLRVYALGETLPSGTCVLSGTLAGARFRSEVPLEASAASAGNVISRLAARARIRDLEEQPDYLEARGSRQRRARTTRDTTSDIVALGVRYQLCSRETSFVAIEHRETPVTDRAELRRVPVMLTHGWGGSDRPHARRADVRQAPHGRADGYVVGSQWVGPGHRVRSAGTAWRRRPRRRPSFFRSGPRGSLRSTEGALRSDAPSPHRRRTITRRLHDAVIRLQRADGSVGPQATLVALVGLDLALVEHALARELAGDGRPGEAPRALATALALAWLRRHAPGYHDEWQMVGDKGQAWLDRYQAAPATPACTGAGWPRPCCEQLTDDRGR